MEISYILRLKTPETVKDDDEASQKHKRGEKMPKMLEAPPKRLALPYKPQLAILVRNRPECKPQIITIEKINWADYDSKPQSKPKTRRNK